ncbi:MAG TPA: aspartate aminotransferase family protein [Verrucomicrobiales bacterium]|jgi:4-aminobutyrate aminotransferase|nr:aspartate aminotransferase family protein [Verrucomicrobiales bacterium]HIL71568.1 aspartate aminotransferase family protein [Verrucomicrobiota bacterium]
MQGPQDSLENLRSEGDINQSPLRSKWSDQNIDEKTRYWLEEDAKYFLHQSLSTPCLNVLKGCSGIYIEDLQGNEILDFHGNNVHQVGFGNPKVLDAIRRQMDELSFCTRRYTNIPAIKLAKKLVELAPGNLNKVLFAPGGTSAMGMALKLARTATGRYKTLSMWDSFHGASLDAISIGGEAVFRKGIGPLLPGCEHAPPPDPRHCLWECGDQCSLKCADYIEYVLEKEGDVAAVIAETVRSTPFIPPSDYWRKVHDACKRHGALLILDEIPHCLGRTGKMFTVEHYDVVPDILVIGKGLGGGVFPLAAILARDGLNVMTDTALGHYTHEKSPVACAAGLAAIEFLEEEKILEKVIDVSGHAMKRLRDLQSKHGLIGDVRGKGLLMGIELFHDGDPSKRACEEAEQVMYAALNKGLSFKLTMGNIITLTPALTITMSEMDKALDILDQSLTEVKAGCRTT